jgi:ADP-ribosylglycohydrolase
MSNPSEQGVSHLVNSAQPLTLWEKWGIEGQTDYDPFDAAEWEAEIAGRRDRAVGALIGLAVGDALGATVECAWTADIYATYGKRGQTEMRGGGPHHLPIGAYTDDTAMMRCLLDSLLHTNRGVATTALMNLNIYDLAGRFVSWMESNPPDIGRTVRASLLKIKAGISPLKAGDDNPLNQANGAVMRCAPIAVLFNNPSHFRQLTMASLLSAYPTHRSPLSVHACILVNQLISELITRGKPFNRAYFKAKEVVTNAEWQTQLAKWEADGCPNLGNAGWVVATVLSALHCVLTTSSFEQALIKAVNGGRDADTVGAVTGAIAGAMYGEKAIPTRWTSMLQEYPTLREQASTLFELGRRY